VFNKRIIQNFVKEESTIRFIICTVAFGLGVNIPDIRFVVHWGACDSALQYWQEAGRAGRDGNEGKAYMYATKSSIIHINEDMKTKGNSTNDESDGRLLLYKVLNNSFLIFTAKTSMKCSNKSIFEIFLPVKVIHLICLCAISLTRLHSCKAKMTLFRLLI
jgi:superfamily II DNA helicase RecQ